MTGIVLTPDSRSKLIELGNHRWKKQLLPLGDVMYKGRRLQFTSEYFAELLRAFKERAFDAVPFQLAGDDNKHTNKVLNRRGTITDLELASDGLDLILNTDDEGDKLLREYPDLGVSARIYEDYNRESDGKHWTAALQHVLATLDPHIVGMRPWQRLEPAELSQSVEFESVIDLSGSEFLEEGKEDSDTVAKEKDVAALQATLKKLREGGDDVELTDSELDQLLTVSESLNDEDELTDEELDQLIAITEALETGGEEKKEEEAESVSDEDINKLLDSDSDDKTKSEEKGEEVAPKMTRTMVAAANAGKKKVTELSNGRKTAIELANARIEEQAIQLSAVQKKLDEQAYEAEKSLFATKYGIPPVITELARKLLEGQSRVVELSNGEDVDASSIMRNVLTAFGEQIKLLDLSSLLGNSNEPTDEQLQQQEAAAKETRAFIDDVKSTYAF